MSYNNGNGGFNPPPKNDFDKIKQDLEKLFGSFGGGNKQARQGGTGGGGGGNNAQTQGQEWLGFLGAYHCRCMEFILYR